MFLLRNYTEYVNYPKQNSGAKEEREMQRNRLKAALTLRGISVDDLCFDIGMSRSAWYRKISGDSEFTREEVARIARRLSLSGEEFITIFFNDAVT